MPDMPTQTFENHVVVPMRWFAAAGSLLVGTVLVIASFALGDSRAGMLVLRAAVALVGVGALATLVLLRSYALTLQNRIIRTEMKMRLTSTLPEDLAGRMAELSTRQMIALRFASDGEIAELTRKVLDERIKDGTAIKRLVRDWQGDYSRV